jgi:hypothetical protein
MSLRSAFSEFFLKVLRQRLNFDFKKDVEGFNPLDMLTHLKALLSHCFVKEFRWKKLSKFTLNKVFFGPFVPLRTVYLIGGWCTTGPVREKLINRIKKATKDIV